MFFLYQDHGSSLGVGLGHHHIDGFAEIYSALPPDAHKARDMVDYFHVEHIRNLVKIDNLKTDLLMHKHIGHNEIKKAEHKIRELEGQISELCEKNTEKNNRIRELEDELRLVKSRLDKLSPKTRKRYSGI